MESIPFFWGNNGPKWKINEKNKKEIKMIKSGPNNCIYSVSTFNSNTYQKIQIKLKIKKIYNISSMPIGIINNFQHKNTWFPTKEIPNNNEIKIKQNMYYCIDIDDGQKNSHITNHKWKQWSNNNNLSYSSGDILIFRIDFVNNLISIGKNNNNIIGNIFENINDIDIKNINWSFVVCSQFKDDCVELLSCKGIKTSIKNAIKEENEKEKESELEKEINLLRAKQLRLMYILLIGLSDSRM